MSDDNTYFEYTELDNGIHQFVFSSDSRDSVYAYIQQAKALEEGVPSGDKLRLLLDFRRTGPPPFSAVTSAIKQTPPRTDIQMRIAHIYNRSSYRVMMQNIVTFNRLNYERKYFSEEEANIVIDWLLEQQ